MAALLLLDIAHRAGSEEATNCMNFAHTAWTIVRLRPVLLIAQEISLGSKHIRDVNCVKARAFTMLHGLRHSLEAISQ